MLYFNIFAAFICNLLLLLETDVVQCTYEYESDIQRWVSHEKIVTTWRDATRKCAKDYAKLASPINLGLLNFMKKQIGVNNHSTPHFIGFQAKYDDDEVKFVSLEGVNLYDIPIEALEMIDKIDPFDGNCLSMDTKNIRAVPCHTRLPFLCYTDVSKNDTNTTTEKPSCGQGYSLYSTGSCYKAHYNNQSYRDSKKVCYEEGGYLVEVNDEAEAHIVKDLHSPPHLYITKWIGLEDRTRRNDWMSVRDTPLSQLYNIWVETNRTAKCGAIQITGLLKDVTCGIKLPFICEKNPKQF